MMSVRAVRVVMFVALVALVAGVVSAQDIKKPDPTVPEIFTLTGEFVRVAYNNEGYATLGYRIANESVAEDWMLLEVGATLEPDDDSGRLLAHAA